MSGPGQLDFVQALRGCAALAVVMYHYRIVIAGGDLFRNGAAGVDLFFVISGFIMVHTTRRLAGGARDAVTFFLRRVARVWPVYVVLTFALLVAQGTLAKYTTTHDGLVWLGRAFVFRPQHADGAPWFGWAPNGVGWTLNYEIWFYLVFAISLFAKRGRLPLLVGMFLFFNIAVPLLLAGTFSWSVYASYHLKPVILNLGASNMSLEFVTGALIGWLYHSSWRVRRRVPLIGFAVLSVAAVVGCQLVDVSFDHHGLFGYGAPMCVMVLALALLDREYPIRVPRVLVWLGNISFSLYLVHKVVQFGLPRVVPQWSQMYSGGTGLCTMLAVAVLLAQLSARFLEDGVAARLQRSLLYLMPRPAAATGQRDIADRTPRASRDSTS